MPGRLYFALFRSDDPGVYISLSAFESRNEFHDWTGSESFRRAHGGGLTDGAVAGRPQLIVADAIYGEGSIASDAT